jgi:hypothetical protein
VDFALGVSKALQGPRQARFKAAQRDILDQLLIVVEPCRDGVQQRLPEGGVFAHAAVKFRRRDQFNFAVHFSNTLGGVTPAFDQAGSGLQADIAWPYPIEHGFAAIGG